MSRVLLAGLCCGLAIGQAVAAQAASTIRREGDYYFQTVTAALPVGSGQRIRVKSSGNLTLRGGAADTLVYFLNKRVRASSVAEAEGALRKLDVRYGQKDGWINLEMATPRNRNYSVELSINAPRNFAQVWLETREGNLIATDLDGEVTARTGGGRIDLDGLHSNTSAKTGGGEIHAGHVDGNLRAYSGGGAIRVNWVRRESWLETLGGDIYVHEAGAPIHAATAGGSIRVDRGANEIYARTAAGVIEVGQAGGLVTAETSGGAIQVNGARGVRCESSSGTIRLRNMQGGVRAATAQGNILAQLQAGQRIEDSLLSTVVGDIIVLLSSNTPVTIQARNESAGSKRRIVSEFQEIRVRNAGWESNDPVVADGILNGGGPVLRIVTSSGVIFLRRQR